ncbi:MULTISPECIES: DUF317 domain-containing protein [Streptomyces]
MLQHAYVHKNVAAPVWSAWGGPPDHPLWKATFSSAVPASLVAAFASSLASPVPLARAMGNIPADTRLHLTLPAALTYAAARQGAGTEPRVGTLVADPAVRARRRQRPGHRARADRSSRPVGQPTQVTAPQNRPLPRSTTTVVPARPALLHRPARPARPRTTSDRRRLLRRRFARLAAAAAH